MARYNITNKRLLGTVAVALSIVACTDNWDEHYNMGSPYDGNLWEAVSSNPNLTNFARVIEACGYDSSLVSSQMFTVFAPTNDYFTAEDANALISAYNEQKAKHVKDNDNMTIKEFVQNHIALYNYSVSSLSNDSIVMMNGKYLPLTSSFIGGSQMSSSKTVGNGILYTVDGRLQYSPNVFEYLEKDADLDSVARFLYSFNKYEFLPALSVPGDIVDGKTQYLDSVTTLTNEIFVELEARLSSEDSTYWMVVPTNDVWCQNTRNISSTTSLLTSVTRCSLSMLAWPCSVERYSVVPTTVTSRSRTLPCLQMPYRMCCVVSFMAQVQTSITNMNVRSSRVVSFMGHRQTNVVMASYIRPVIGI